MTQRIEKTFTIVNSLGLHARPAAMVVQTANRFKSEVQFEKDGLQINAKSIMGVLTLAAGRGSSVLVSCEGPDAAEAMVAIARVFETGFGER
ncbi:MAG: HPr family phosphocarrier protein [Anaeromyxobacteraceae bacterium]